MADEEKEVAEEKIVKMPNQVLERFIVSYLLKNSSFLLQTGEYLKTSDASKVSNFQDDKLQYLINFATKYQDKYKSPPNEKVMDVLIEGFCKNNEELKKVLHSVSKELYELEPKEISSELIETETINHIMRNRSVRGILKCQTLIQKGDYDAITDEIRNALNVSFDKDLGTDVKDIKTSLELINHVSEDTGLSYGTETLNKWLDGTPQPGELTLFAAPPGIGKSIWLANCAVENFKKGKNVVFISMEMSESRILTRFYPAIFNRTLKEVIQVTENDIKGWLGKEGNVGNLRLKEFESNVQSANDIEAYLDRLESVTGIKTDLLIVDYLGIVASNSKSSSEENSFARLKAVSEQLRNLGKTRHIPVISAVQLNRDGMGEKGGTKQFTGLATIAESKGIVDTADNIFMIQQTPEEKGKGIYRIRIGKARNSSGVGEKAFGINYQTMRINDISDASLLKHV